jgi:nucleotide-binding universal stress UspA family protein
MQSMSDIRRMRVLLATDGAAPARRACEWLGQILHGPVQVRIVTVLSYSLYPYAMYPGGELADETVRVHQVDDAVDAATNEDRMILEKAGFQVDVTHRFGNAPDEIIREIERWKPDLLVMGRRGVHGLERILGSVSEHVLRRADVPVLLGPLG